MQTEYYTRRKESFARTKSKDHAGKIKFQLSVQSTVRDTRSKEEKKRISAVIVVNFLNTFPVEFYNIQIENHIPTILFIIIKSLDLLSKL